MSYLENIFELELKQNGILVEPFDTKNYNGSHYCYSQFRLFALIVGKEKGMQKRLKDLGLNDFKFDFAFPSHKLLIELHGGTNAYGKHRGRHIRPSGFESDRKKMNDAVMNGWRVLEFTTDMIKNKIAIEQTIKYLDFYPQ